MSAQRTGVRGSKGVHLAVPAHRVGNRGAVTLLSAVDGRVMFVLPGGQLTIIGTTETETPSTVRHVRATSADVDYLLPPSTLHSPCASHRGQCRVRVGRNSAAGRVGSSRGRSECVARARDRARSASGMMTVTGGKLTTYRAMAAEVVDTVLG